MYELLLDPKELRFYPGCAYGTEIFATRGEKPIEKLNEFIGSPPGA